ncbi:MAG TPA: protein translocase subunit SecF [Longimicrobiaceae bacterium]|nr:protein translocase subunit SecF [Longimicrobiaceae bacterium]
MRIFADANYPFLSWRRKAYVASAALLLFGIGAMIVNTVSTGTWLSYGVDFAGGTMVHVDFAEQVQADQIRAVDPTWQITRFGEPGESEYLIRVPLVQDQLNDDPAQEVLEALQGEFGENALQLIRTEAVSARVGDELQQRALLAILISMVLTLIYLAFRFEWRFGSAATIATAHDVLLTLGLLAALRMEVSIATVAAFLTIVGYSLNDTIVVFDRIRENLAKRMRGQSYTEIVDRSINETLPRTILTTGTTLTTLLALYLFGGAVIRDFALVLILGIVIGTFSSIFVASPALAAIEARWPRDTRKRSARGPTSPRRREPASV